MNRQPKKHPDPTPETLLQTAQRFRNAVAVLIAHPSDFGVAPIGHLASHSVEVALKSLLLKRGHTTAQLKDMSHSLENAWKAAVEVGLPFDGDPPVWLRTLDFHHDRPFMYRYKPEGYGLGIPKPEDLLVELNNLLGALEKEIAKG